jgi:RNA polymerase sigma factor (sigma-70 family)
MSEAHDTRSDTLRFEQVLNLLPAECRVVEPGEVCCEERLNRLIRYLLARYRLPATMGEDLVGETYCILHRLTLQYDPDRGVPYLAYLNHTLPDAIWSWVRQRQKEITREPTISQIMPIDEHGNVELRSDAGELPKDARDLDRSAGVIGKSVEESVLLRVALEEAMATLQPRQRQIIELYSRGHTAEEMAEKLGMTTEACHKALQRARGALRCTLRELIE